MWESENEGKRRNWPHTVSTLWTRVHEDDDKQSRAAHRLQKCPCTENITAQLKFRHLIELFLQFIQSFLGLLQSME